METWVKDYLHRIGYQGSTAPNPTNLAELHQAHMYSVPFEDLDIHRGVKLSLELKRLVGKVVHHKRGGFCYELNYLFGTLLLKLGFQVTFLSGRVIDERGSVGPEYDHMTLLIESNGKWLADVGFGGGSFTRPLRLKKDSVQVNEAGNYEISQLQTGEYQLSWSPDGVSYKPQYNFTLEPKKIQDFEAECQWKQVNKNSHFVRNKICTMATPQGRKSLLNDSFTIRLNDQKNTEVIESLEMEKAILKEHFNIEYQPM